MNNSNDKTLPFVSILLANYNGMDHLEEFLTSAYTLNYPKDRFEVVIVDNASTDGSAEWIEQNYPQVKLVREKKNHGFAVGNNIGAKYCQGEFLALQNNDTRLDKDWLIELIREAIKDPEGLYGSTMLWHSRPDHVVYGGGKYFAWGDAFHLDCYTKEKPGQEAFVTMYADGCGELLAKKVFLEIGGFDETYFCYAEDYELSWKARILGHQVYMVPKARFWHKVSSVYGNRSSTYIYYLLRNQLRNMIKFAECPTLLVMYPGFMAYYLTLYAAVYSLQEKNFSLIFPMLKAYLKIVFELPRLFKVRRKFQKQRKIKDRQLKKLGLILNFSQSVREAFATLKRKNEFFKVIQT